MVGLRKLVISVMVAATLMLAAVTIWTLAAVIRPLPLSQPLELDVKPGAHAKQILQQLAAKGVDLSVLVSYAGTRLLQQGQHLQAGVYEIAVGTSLQQLWDDIQRGQSKQFQVTLVEGQNWQQWQQTLAQQQYLNTEALAWSEQRLLKTLGANEYPALEGVLLAETYQYKAYTSVLQVLQAAHQALTEELNQVWLQRSDNLPYKNRYQLLTMASIIEKETGVAGERAIVSSVFVNRLRTGMRLQSDPTTIYGIQDFDGNLTRAHLRQVTAYNTYRIDGLPPTPIAMPSLASLRDAATPAITDYFYFVADGSGGHVFSRTLAEHNRAVNLYQRNLGTP